MKLGEAERRLRKAEKASQLQEGVDTIRDHAIKELGDKLDVHEKIIRNIVNGGTHYVKHCCAGAFNALIHKATGEMNGGKSLFFHFRVTGPDIGLLQISRPANASSSKKYRTPY